MCAVRGRALITFAADSYGSVTLGVDVQGDVRQDVVLVPEAAITGRVVAMSDGKPIANALVRAHAWRRGPAFPADASTISDSDGRFRLSALLPERYGIDALTEGAVSDRVAATAHVGAAHDIEIRVGAMGRITGRVTSHGQFVAGARLVAVRVSPNAYSEVGVSQPDGTFDIEHVPIGDVTLSAAPYRVVSSATVKVNSAPVHVDVEVERLATIHGRVTRKGVPAPDATVCCIKPVDGGVETVLSDGSGAYVFTGVRPGTQQVSATSEELGASEEPVALTVGEGDDRTVDIVMNLAAAISGTVVDEQGHPVTGVVVRWTNELTGDLGKGVTDSAGRYRCTAMTGGGKYRAAVASGVRAATYPPAAGTMYPELDVPDGTADLHDARIAIQYQMLAIAGRVTDAAGAPVADAVVKATEMPPNGTPTFHSWMKLPQTFTDGDGAFTLPGLPAGVYALGARSADGGEGTAAGIAAGSTTAAIRIERLGAITGSLAGFPATPIVYVADAVPPIDATQADAVDPTSFHIGGLRPGRYVVNASTEHDGDAKLVDVVSGQTTAVALVARGHAAVDVTVLDFKTRAPIAGAGCHVASAIDGISGITNWSARAAPTTDATGHAELDPVPAGPGIALCVTSSLSMSTPSADVALAAGSRSHVQLLSVPMTTGFPVTIGAGFDWRTASPRFASVDANGPAANAGLQVGDLVTAVDGASVAGVNGEGVAALIAAHTAGAPIQLGIARGAAQLSVSVAGQPLVFQ